MSDKPSLHMFNPRDSGFEDFLAFFTSLTGKETAPEELPRLRESWERLQARLRQGKAPDATGENTLPGSH